MNTSSSSVSCRRQVPCRWEATQVPGRVSRLLKWCQRQDGMVSDSIPDPYPRSRTKLLPLPVTCLAVLSVQDVYLQRHSSPPRPCPRPPPLPPLQVPGVSAWLRNVAATSLGPEGEPLPYQRANEYECGFFQTEPGWTHNEPSTF